MTLPAYIDSLLSLSISEHRPGGDTAGRPDLANIDAILVLGHQLEEDGGLKPRLVDRLVTAKVLAEKNPSCRLVLTGARLGAPRSEAEAMAAWLAGEGIAPKRIELEQQAEDTLENVAYSLAILRRLGARKVALVSSTYHIRRGLVLLHALAGRWGDDIVFTHLAAIDPSRPVALDHPDDEERALILQDFKRAMTIDLVRYASP